MTSHALRRTVVAVLLGCVLFGGCTRSTLDDQVGRRSGAASSTTSETPSGSSAPSSTTGGSTSTPGSGPATSGSSTSSTAASANATTVNRGQPGAVQLPDGARVTVPAGAVTSDSAQLRLDGDGASGYTVAVDGTIQGATEVRVPTGTTDPAHQSFMLVKTPDGWLVPPAERRDDGFLYASLGVPVTVRPVTCNAKLPNQAPDVLACLTGAGVTQLSKPVADQMAAGLTCGAPWPTTSLLRREDYCLTAPTVPATTVPATTVPPTTAPSTPTTAAPSGPSGGGNPAPTAPPRSEPLRVSFSENPVVCNGQRRTFGVVSNAVPGEQVSFTSPTISLLLPGTADDSGQVTIHWRCDPGDAANVWSLTATGTSSGRTVTFTFGGSAG